MTAKPSAWWRVIDWRLVLAAGLPAWLLVAGVVAWAKLRTKCGTIPIPGEPPVVVVTPVVPVVAEAAPLPRLVREVAELPRLVREDAPPPRAAVDPVVDLKPLLNVMVDLGKRQMEPKPVAKVDARPPAKPVPDGCKTHGTAVHFVKSTVTAMKQAQAKDKLVFVLHLSGNIEDDGFT